MEDVDLAIACGGATAAEGHDRSTLRLDQHDYLHRLGRAAKARRTSHPTLAPLAVVALAPGAFLTDWSPNVEALVAMFLSLWPGLLKPSQTFSTFSNQ